MLDGEIVVTAVMSCETNVTNRDNWKIIPNLGRLSILIKEIPIMLL